MIKFLAGIIDQLALAREHLERGGVSEARFGLMLIDNALELVLYQFAQDEQFNARSRAWREPTYAHQRQLTAALGPAFDAKVKFARLLGKIDDATAETFRIMHELRNVVYHVGIEHEEILEEASKYYFLRVCRFLLDYTPRFWSWGSNFTMPERAKPHLQLGKFMPFEREDFSKACDALAAGFENSGPPLVTALSAHLERIISHQDLCLDIIAEGAYQHQTTTRVAALVSAQAWQLAATDEGKAFGQDQGEPHWFALVALIERQHPKLIRKDPIPNWTRRARRLRGLSNDPDKALKLYDEFLSQTEFAREAVLEATAACEAEIDSAIDRARGK